MTKVTRDSISLSGTGVVTLDQPADGVRFTLDSLLLADFCRIRPRDKIVEPGAGTGVISLLLAEKFSSVRIIADEAEPIAYELLCRNIAANGFGKRITPVPYDIRSLNRRLEPNAFDVIVANPPYTKSGTGRKSPCAERLMARHDESAPLSAWLDLQTLLKNKGRYFLVFSATRAAELLVLLRDRNLEPKRIRFAHPSRAKPASLVLVESTKSARSGLEILPPLFVHEAAGTYTPEMRSIYGII
jgi:tRNA1Val (adenine37-N6)-methyltransferase